MEIFVATIKFFLKKIFWKEFKLIAQMLHLSIFNRQFDRQFQNAIHNPEIVEELGDQWLNIFARPSTTFCLDCIFQLNILNLVTMKLLFGIFLLKLLVETISGKKQEILTVKRFVIEISKGNVRNQ